MKTIQITSLKTKTRLSIQAAGQPLRVRYFSNLNEAIQYALPLGDAGTAMYLNGYRCVLHGWVS